MPILDFKGKSVIYSYHHEVPFRSLQIDDTKSFSAKIKNRKKVKPSLDDNLIIHGDNLHALKALLPKYAGRVKCVYIDPPYNTGNEGWKYNDKVNSPIIKEWLKQSGIGTDDLERHDKWLCMMWPRLNLLKELLSDDGVIFISIDDNEQHRLRMIMDEVFGEGNFIANISWWSKYTVSNDASKISYQHENILFYAKNANLFKIGLFPRTKEMDDTYKNPDNDPKGRWKSTPLHAKSGKESDRYSITFPNGVFWQCPEGTYPRYTKENIIKLYHKGAIYFGKNGKSNPRKKTYLSEVKQGKTVGSFWSYKEVGSTHTANEDLSQILGKGKFDNPKGVRLIKQIIQVANVSTDDIILDSFAGSGTTAQAVLELNKEDGGNRKFILVECESYADKITAERVRRIINGVPKAKDENLQTGLGGSFTYCSLGKAINTENLLKGKKLPDYKQLAEYVFYTATGKSLDKLPKTNPTWFIGETLAYKLHLVYKPNLDFLKSKKSALHLTLAEKIKKCNKQSKKISLVFAPAKYFTQKKLLKDYGIQFCQLPYDIHKIIEA